MVRRCLVTVAVAARRAQASRVQMAETHMVEDRRVRSADSEQHSLLAGQVEQMRRELEEANNRATRAETLSLSVRDAALVHSQEDATSLTAKVAALEGKRASVSLDLDAMQSALVDAERALESKQAEALKAAEESLQQRLLPGAAAGRGACGGLRRLQRRGGQCAAQAAHALGAAVAARWGRLCGCAHRGCSSV